MEGEVSFIDKPKLDDKLAQNDDFLTTEEKERGEALGKDRRKRKSASKGKSFS